MSADILMTTESGPSEETPTTPMKRKSSSSDESENERAPRKKRQRQFKWTEKNKSSFEKCQTMRKLKQAVEQSRKILGLVLVTTLEQDISSTTVTLSSVAEEALKELIANKKVLEDYQIANPPKEKKESDSKEEGEGDVSVVKVEE